MAFMRLCRGFNVYDADFVEYPIFEMTIPTNANVVSWGNGRFPLGVEGSAIGFDYSPANEDLSPFFPETMPRRNSDDGCIVQNDFYYVQGVSSKIPNEQAFSDVPIGTKPNDWDEHFFDYYRIIQMGAYTVFDSVANQGLTYQNSPPVWDSTAAYYHDDLPIKSRFTQLFTTAAGVTFKVGVSTNTMYSYNRWECNINGNSAFGGESQVSAPHYMGTAASNLGTNSTISYPNKLPVSPNELNLPTNVLQIFVHTVYNDIDYYGYGVVRMSAISETAHPIQANFCLFTIDFWGDSIQGGSPSQGGNWGADSERAGGDGTFSAPSNNDGDRNGTSLLSAISTANTTFKTVLGGNYNLYYVPPADLTKILAVLYSSDYFQRFENSMYNPLSAVLNCALVPEIFCSYSASVSDMTAGGYNISQNIFPNPVQFATPEPLIMRHIGDIDIPNYFGAFPDYAPYTQCKLHLPYIGEITIDINKIANGTLSIDYVCDVMSGNVTAWIWCNDKDGNHTYCYNATGNCAYSIPLFANSSDGSAIGKIIGGIASIAAGNVFSGVASTASGAASAISRHTQISGTFSGNVGLTTNPKCFAEFSRPQWVNPTNYQNQSGIPSQISGKLSDFHGGFVQVETIDLQNVPATEAELSEIESLLESGIYYVSN